MDEYQRKNEQAFANIRTDICENEMNDEMSRMKQFNDAIRRSNSTYNPTLIASYCGPDGYECYSSFNSLLDNLPKCADRMIESSTFTDGNLVLQGNQDQYDVLVGRYMAVITTSYKNILWLIGKRAAQTIPKGATAIPKDVQQTVDIQAAQTMDNYVELLSAMQQK